ncbi:MAG: HAD hydrolase-like protein [Oscillospiraceae bacterium]|nr:HAD hydrolase-like protein [Oscillospiraceae bacterium]
MKKNKINKKYILFDLDGTLTDSKPGILNSFRYALNYFGVEIKDEELDSYSYLIGPPLREGFDKVSKIFNNSIDFDEAIAKFREYYTVKGMFENNLYFGIDGLLKNLKDSGKIIILATSKAEKFAVKILEHFDLQKYFDFTVGAGLDGKRSDKAGIIARALDYFNIARPEEKAAAIMIGDRVHDIEGAAKNNIESVGVLYGYGGEEELTSGEFRSDYIARNVGELAELLGVGAIINRP